MCTVFHVTNTSLDPTGITGIWQHPNPRPALVKVYEHTLSLLSSKFPTESVYRQSVENLTKARKQIVEENEVGEVIEQKIGAGLIEEILEQAAEEFRLAEYLADQKPWEELEVKPSEDQWKYFDRSE
ncbi:hypothetical protein AWJ20_5010 [Sugiyamaella lignohabitans]|uniref:Uncharacterized protein n=1 Tax=Sugiyamaella lignohabitans TaxID=796027 RepID=A0A167EGH2_9ASCO|nr:uncharacterized protein AWJ20_5010 [Sugiyamaella lignohabitans]ANB14054.1 hypothetical protein AWJ20_5010 [Sugiyamaella lignohabitans]